MARLLSFRMRALLALIRYFSGRGSCWVRTRPVARIDDCSASLSKSEFQLNIRQGGKGEGKFGILIRSCLQILDRIQVLARAHEGRALVVVAQGLGRFGAGLEGLRLQLIHHRGGERKVLADGVGQVVDGRGQILHQSLRLDGHSLVVDQVANSGIDHDLVTETGVLPGDDQRRRC